MALAISDKPTARPQHQVRPAARTGDHVASPIFGGRLRQSLQAWSAAFAEAKPEHLTLTQLEVLDALDRHAPCNSTTLIVATGIDRSTAADVLRRLKKRGAIERKRHKDDARAYVTHLTGSGRTLLREGRKAAQKADRLREKIMSSLQPSD